MTRRLLSVLLSLLAANPAFAAGPVRGRWNVEYVRDLPGSGSYIHLVGQSLFLTPDRASSKKVEPKPVVPGTWFDIGSDPASPTVVNNALPSAWDVVVDGDFAFACDYQKFVTVYDIRDRQWREVTRLTMPSMAENLVLRDKLLFVANHVAGLTIVDVSAPQTSVIVSNLNPHIDCDAVAIWKNTAVLYGHWECKIVVADISDPAKPKVTGECQLPPKIFNGGELEVSDGYAYATTTTGLVVLNVTDPNAPKLIATADIGGVVNDVILLDHFAFVASRQSGVRILDIQDPAKPVEVGYDSTSASALAVQRVAGSETQYRIYTAGRTPAVLVFHAPAANPSSPRN